MSTFNKFTGQSRNTGGDNRYASFKGSDVRRQKYENLVQKTLKLTERRYQTELYNEALKENVIIFLGTGLGKTFISVLYLNSPQVAAQIESGRRVFFLAPTQDLIKQQAEYFQKQVDYRVKIYCGRTYSCEVHIDKWDRPTWLKEMASVEVLFMTPQIFSSAVSTNLISWSEVSSIIFDECHHAYVSTKSKGVGHPYSQILDHYRLKYLYNVQSSKPRLIGLTASLINRMPKNREDIKQSIKVLEKTFSARCVTDTEVQEFKPMMAINSHCPSRFVSNGKLMAPTDHSLAKIFEGFIKVLEIALSTRELHRQRRERAHYLTQDEARIASFCKRLQLASMGFSIKPSKFPKVFSAFLKLLQRCGIWHAKAFCKICITAMEKSPLITNQNDDIRELYLHLLDILRRIEKALGDFLKNIEHEGLLQARPQPMALLDVLKYEYNRIKDGTSEKSHFSCIVFVRSRLEVRLLSLWLQDVSARIPEYAFIKCDYAIGMAAAATSTYAFITKKKPAEQSRMLDNFREQFLNVVITTSVLEEGIDLPVCSTVIRYDLPNNFREYVQSRGRARQKVSSFIAMCDFSSVEKTRDHFNKLNDFEVTLQDHFRSGRIAEQVSRLPRQTEVTKIVENKKEEEEEDVFINNQGDIRIAPDVGRIILNMYCSSRLRDKPYAEGMTFERVTLGIEKYQTTLYLPSCCFFTSGISGGIRDSLVGSDNSAVIAAVRFLYENKQLDEHCVPIRISMATIDSLLLEHNLDAKYDELPKALQGSVVMEGTREISYFNSKLFMLDQCLPDNIQNRTYKMLRLTYVPEQGHCRRDTLRYFEKSRFGIIVDSRINNEFVPSHLYGHYGKFKVVCEQVRDNFSINRRVDHEEFLDFTHRFLRCLSYGIYKENFRNNCQFYVVLLDCKNQPDSRAMHNSFRLQPRRSLEVGDVVKLTTFYRMNRNEQRGRGPKEDDRIMIVKEIHSNMNANSLIPHDRYRQTFLEAAERHYGQGIVRNINQPVIEVMPISMDYARSSLGKTAKQDYSSTNIFFLADFLQYFDNDAATVMQAFNKPQILYRLYLNAMARGFDERFLTKTDEKRREKLLYKPNEELTNLVLVDDNNLENQQPPVEFVEPEIEQSNENDGTSIDSSDKDFELVDSDDSYDSDDCDESSDADSSCDNSSCDESEELLDAKESKEILTRQSFDFNQEEDDERWKRWDLSKYKADNIKSLNIQERKSFYDDYSIYSREAIGFDELIRDIQTPFLNLVQKIQDFRNRITSDQLKLDEDSDFGKRNATVDLSIVPPIKFDRNAKALKEASRERSILEALTLSRAGELYNLEGLENVGDSYLKYVVSVVLYKKLDTDEGLLTAARSRLTCNKYFNHLAKKSSLGTYAITSGFSKDLFSSIVGNRGRNEADNRRRLNKMRLKDMADLFESIVGSYLIYHGEFEAILAIEWLGLNIFEGQTFDEFHNGAVVFSKSPSALIDVTGAKELLAMFKKKVQRFEQVIKYSFSDASYLVQALTHSTSVDRCTPTYERLEFLGDAILDYLVTTHLVSQGNLLEPGILTSSRSAVVNNCAFAKLALRYRYDLYIQHLSQDLHIELNNVRELMEDDEELSFLESVDYDRIVKLLGDVFESVAGAIYVDSGFSLDTVWSIYYPMMKNSLDQEIKSPSKNYIMELYETFPGQGRIKYEESKTEESVKVICTIEGFGSFEGIGLNKKQAKQRAIRAAMTNPPSRELKEKLDKEFNEKNPIKTTRENRPRGSRDGSSRGRSSRGGGPSRRGSSRDSRNYRPRQASTDSRREGQWR